MTETEIHPNFVAMVPLLVQDFIAPMPNLQAGQSIPTNGNIPWDFEAPREGPSDVCPAACKAPGPRFEGRIFMRKMQVIDCRRAFLGDHMSQVFGASIF